jgi:hypothetical protein
MITCPFCNKLVNLDNTVHRANAPIINLEDNATDDFWCPTNVETYNDFWWCHYSRVTTQGGYPMYEAIVPPFDIRWWDGENRILVRQFGIDPTDFRIHRLIYEAYYTDYNGFLTMCERFQNLRVFS